VRTLYKATLDQPLRDQINKEYPKLLQEPDSEKDSKEKEDKATWQGKYLGGETRNWGVKK